MVNTKSPNRKRKSTGTPNAGTPKFAKIATPGKTPRPQNNGTPGPKSPLSTPGQKDTPRPKGPIGTPGEQKNTLRAKGRKFTPGKKSPKGTPSPKGPKSPRFTPGKKGAKNSPAQKLKKFEGTAKLPKGEKKPKTEEEQKKREGRKSKKSTFLRLRNKVTSGDKEALKDVEARIQQIKGRQEMSRSSKRKLKLLLRLRCTLTGEDRKSEVINVTKKREPKKKAVPIKTEVKEEKEEEDNSKEESDLEEEEEISDQDDDSEAGSDEEEESDDVEGQQEVKPPGKTQNADKKTRYVLFVGNLPYDATKEEISSHFAKAGEVRHIRIPADQKTNKPRGFAYVEFKNEVAYQKGLSLHHTSIKGRRINVLYTQGGKKQSEQKKNQVKAKNFKLQAMRKQGQLAGSVKPKKKRSARRAKKNPKPVNGS